MSVSNFEVISNIELQMIHEQFSEIMKCSKVNNEKLSEVLKDANTFWLNNKTVNVAITYKKIFNYILMARIIAAGANIVNQTNFRDIKNQVTKFLEHQHIECFGCNLVDDKINIFCRLHGIYRVQFPVTAMV